MKTLPDGLLNNPPKGFGVSQEVGEGVRIGYRHPYAGCVGVFLAIWACVWLGATGTMLLIGLAAGGGPLVFLSGLFFLVGLLVVVFGTRSLFTCYSFLLQDDALTIVTSVFGDEKGRRVLATDVNRVVLKLRITSSADPQAPSVQRSWSVDLDARERISVLRGAGQAQAEWLATVLAAWAKVELSREGPRC